MAAAVEGLKHVGAVLGGDPRAGVRHLDLDGAVRRCRPDRDGAVRGSVANRVLEQVQEHPAELVGIPVGGGEVQGELRLESHPRGLRGGAHQLAGLADELREIDGPGAPGHLARIEAGELEEIVDQGPQGAHVSAHRVHVAARGGGVNELVLERLREQPQRAERGAQVVGDRRDHLTAGRVGRVACVLLRGERRDHAVGGAREVLELATRVGLDLDLPLPALQRVETLADRMHVAHRPPQQELRGTGGDDRREQQDRDGHPGVVGGYEHHGGPDRDRGEELPEGETYTELEAVVQRGQPQAPAVGEPGERQREQPDGQEDLDGREQGAADGGHHRAGGEQREQQHRDRAPRRAPRRASRRCPPIASTPRGGERQPTPIASGPRGRKR